MAEERAQRRLAAIVAVDVVGYSRMVQADEAGTIAALRTWRGVALEPLVAEHGGRVVKLMGDGALLEFASAVNAVECAVDLQGRTAESNDRLPVDRALVLRIGVNLGDIVVEGDDIFGDGVNVAARLEAMAEPGGICLSGKVFDEVSGKLDLEFETLGEVALKNMATPIRAYRLAKDGAEYGESLVPPIQAKTSIAVLPFANMSGDPSQQYFCDGITEDMITELQRFRSLSVTARNSSFRFRDGASDIKRVGRELGVRYIVEGSVRKAGDRVRLVTQLIDAETAAHLWAERYDRRMEDIFAIHDDISRSVVTTLWSAIDEAEIARARRKVPSQMAAYDYVLRARNVWFDWTAESNAEAHSLITKALEIDPRYSTAWSWLAWVHIEDWRSGRGDDPIQSLTLAEKAARKAIELDPHDYFSHWPMAFVLVRLRRYQEGLAEYEKTLALNPNDSRLLDDMSTALCLAGHPAKAIEQSGLAIQLDPLHPEWFFGNLGLAHYMLRDYDAAIAVMAGMVNIAHGSHLDIRAAAYAQAGLEPEARSTMSEFLRMRPNRNIRQTRNELPFRDPDDLEHFLEGLRKAGMPE